MISLPASAVSPASSLLKKGDSPGAPGADPVPDFQQPDNVAFDRLRRTATFREGGHDRWCRAHLLVIGCGTLGSRLSTEIVRSGASVTLVDPDVGQPHNTGTQAVVAGQPKAPAVAAACGQIRPGSARSLVSDVLHAGVGPFVDCQAIVDVTDDPNLALPLTLLSNGLGIPLVRAAVDGSGAHELGRVLVSHGGAGYACQICNSAENDLLGLRATPCIGGRPDRPSTLAGGAIASAIVGICLLQLQRLITGNDSHLAFNVELILDLSNLQLLPIEHRRSVSCLSRHERWSLVPVAQTADGLTVAKTFELAERIGGSTNVAIEPFLHPLHVGASCTCGTRQMAAGTRWHAAPSCTECGSAMTWSGHQLSRLNRSQIETLKLEDRTWLDLGMPAAGAMFAIHRAGAAPVHLVLA